MIFKFKIIFILFSSQLIESFKISHATFYLSNLQLFLVIHDMAVLNFIIFDNNYSLEMLHANIKVHLVETIFLLLLV
jgi:hypothetical protein